MDRFAGWWGHRKTDRFQMKSEFIPTPGAAGYQLSNPPVVCVAALRASLELFSEATMPRLRAKSLRLTAYLERLVRSQLADSVRIITPTDPEQRGAQLSIVFTNGVPLRKMCDKLIEQGVIVDIREPDVMRVAPAPIYNSFQDVYDIIELISLTMVMVMSAESKL
jgi:kynureninase